MFPFLVWTALRLRAGMVAWALVAVAAVAVWGVVTGQGNFDAASRGAGAQSLAVQAFLAIASVTILTLTVALAERRSATQRRTLF